MKTTNIKGQSIYVAENTNIQKLKPNRLFTPRFCVILGQITTASSDSDPLTSPLTVRALLGPVSPLDAVKIQQEWKKSNQVQMLKRFFVRNLLIIVIS
jgi:hypothetical protein